MDSVVSNCRIQLYNKLQKNLSGLLLNAFPQFSLTASGEPVRTVIWVNNQMWDLLRIKCVKNLKKKKVIFFIICAIWNMSLHQILHLFTMPSSDFGIGINEYYPITAFAITVDDLKTWPHSARFAVNKMAESPTPDKFIIYISLQYGDLLFMPLKLQWPSRQKHYAPLKFWELFTQEYSKTSHMTWI